MQDLQKGHVARVLIAISGVCFRHPIAAVIGCGFLFLVSAVLGATQLELRMDWKYLFAPGDPVVQASDAERKIFPYPGDIGVLVDRGTAREREAFLDELAVKLEQEPEIFFHVFYRFPLKELAPKALYFLDEELLSQLEAGLDSLENTEGSWTALDQGRGKEILLKLLTDLDLALKSRGRADYVPIWEFLATEQEGEVGEYVRKLLQGDPYVYATLGKGKLHALVLMAGPRGNPLAPQNDAVERLRELVEEMRPTVPQLRVRVTGFPVMLYDERVTCTQDSIRSGLISMVLIFIVFSIGFGEVSRPLMAVSALTCGLVWTIGYTTIAVGHLNFITVSLVTMLMGLGIDFGIHILFRFDEELSLERTPEDAIAHTMAGTGVDTFVGATATAAAFLALTQAQFRGISDFGIIAAGGVMLCFLSTITVLPAFLALAPGRIRKSPQGETFLAWLEKNLLDSAPLVTGLGLCLLLGSLHWATNVGFSYNLLEVQAKEIASVQTEIEMIQDLNATVLSAESLAHDLGEARRLVDAFEALPAVASTGSLVPLLPQVTPQKQALIERITRKIDRVQLPQKISLDDANDLLALEKRLENFQQALPDVPLDPELEEAISNVKEDVEGMDPGPVQDGLKVFQRQVRGDLTQTLEFLKSQQPEPPGLEDIPEDLRVRYVSPEGIHKITIMPTDNIWEKAELEEFLGQLKAVDDDLLGHPVVQEHILGAFNRAFERTPWFTLFGVLLVMLIYLRSPTAIALSLLPTATGVLMIFATMGLVGIEFNVVNFVALPMSVGIGAVYGVHALHRMRELRDETVLTSSTGPALLLSGVTTMVGFASLMTAHHRGLSSLGFVISVGVAVNFVASLIFLPSIRRVIRTRTLARAQARRRQRNEERRAKRAAAQATEEEDA